MHLKRKLNQQSLSGAAAGSKQARTQECSAGDHYARPKTRSSADTIRLFAKDGSDVKRLAAEFDRVSDASVHADEKLIGNDDGVARECDDQRLRGIKNCGSIIGILRGIDDLERDQQRNRIGRNRGH